ncbi:MAG TPA: UDP-glucose 4-epimerase GalE [Bacteroidia bacterium]|nr:UDP-glucose 4-epimerase GalE [Bacteroidia bacterium]
MTQKKILITGGTGYIGSHTVVELINRGFEVYILDNLSNSREEVVESIERITSVKPVFHKIDICNYDLLENFFQSTHIDAIVHFAALKAVGDSVIMPLAYYRNNIVSLLNLLDMCMKYDINNFVFSSSCTVYGQPDKLPVSESAPLKPAESPYGSTKKISEDILRDTSKISTLKSIALRYFNPVGAHPSALIGEYPLGKPNNLMPVITQTAIGKNDMLEVFGDDYNTPDGSCIRDYLHVSDLAQAHVVAVERLLNNKNKDKFEVFNLGTGAGVSVFEMVNAFIDLTGVKLKYKISGRRKGDVEKVYADTTKANTELNWKAKRTLNDMVETAWKWELALDKKAEFKKA